MDLYSPDQMFAALEAAAEERANAEYTAYLLEKDGEILLAHLMVQAKAEGEAIGMCKEVARTQPEWKKHVKGEAVAIQRRSRARAKYANLQALSEARRTQEVTMRALTT